MSIEHSSRERPIDQKSAVGHVASSHYNGQKRVIRLVIVYLEVPWKLIYNFISLHELLLGTDGVYSKACITNQKSESRKPSAQRQKRLEKRRKSKSTKSLFDQENINFRNIADSHKLKMYKNVGINQKN